MPVRTDGGGEFIFDATAGGAEVAGLNLSQQSLGLFQSHADLRRCLPGKANNQEIRATESSTAAHRTDSDNHGVTTPRWLPRVTG